MPLQVLDQSILILAGHVDPRRDLLPPLLRKRGREGVLVLDLASGLIARAAPLLAMPWLASSEEEAQREAKGSARRANGPRAMESRAVINEDVGEGDSGEQVPATHCRNPQQCFAYEPSGATADARARTHSPTARGIRLMVGKANHEWSQNVTQTFEKEAEAEAQGCYTKQTLRTFCLYEVGDQCGKGKTRLSCATMTGAEWNRNLSKEAKTVATAEMLNIRSWPCALQEVTSSKEAVGIDSCKFLANWGSAFLFKEGWGINPQWMGSKVAQVKVRVAGKCTYRHLVVWQPGNSSHVSSLEPKEWARIKRECEAAFWTLTTIS